MAKAKYDKYMVKVSREGRPDPHNPEYLVAEIEGYMGDERQIINTISALFISGNVTYGQVTWRSYEKPHIQIAMKLSSEIGRFRPRINK